jgi:hypothetical protein
MMGCPADSSMMAACRTWLHALVRQVTGARHFQQGCIHSWFKCASCLGPVDM